MTDAKNCGTKSWGLSNDQRREMQDQIAKKSVLTTTIVSKSVLPKMEGKEGCEH